jgi:hypothetical protein
MTLFIHIGTHKTGTTAIQRFAMEHREALRERGLWYPLYQDFGLKAHYAHHRLAHALAGDEEEATRSARTFADKVLSERHAGEAVLISAEPIYRHVYPRKTPDYWAGRAEYAKRLRTLFPAADVQIVLVIRRQDNFARSLYQERVKVTRYDEPFSTFIETEPHQFQYFRQLEVFLEEFPGAQVLIYEDLCSSNLIDAFFDAFGVDTRDLMREEHRNIGWPISMVEFKRCLNGSSLTDDQLRESQNALAKSAADIQNSADWFAGDDAADFVAKFDETNRQIAKAYFPDRAAPLFEPPVRSDHPIFAGLSSEEIGELSALLVRNKPPQQRIGPLQKLLRRLSHK